MERGKVEKLKGWKVKKLKGWKVKSWKVKSWKVGKCLSVAACKSAVKSTQYRPFGIIVS